MDSLLFADMVDCSFGCRALAGQGPLRREALMRLWVREGIASDRAPIEPGLSLIFPTSCVLFLSFSFFLL